MPRGVKGTKTIKEETPTKKVTSTKKKTSTVAKKTSTKATKSKEVFSFGSGCCWTRCPCYHHGSVGSRERLCR